MPVFNEQPKDQAPQPAIVDGAGTAYSLGWCWRIRVGLIRLCALAVAMVMPMTASSAGQTTDTKIIASIDAAARANSLSNKILSRLLWVESRFQTTVISPTGAQGIAQFMPATAADRGVANPFVAAQAIPHAAKFLADLDLRFGNIGLAVAAYNAGSGRIARWLIGTGHLPKETQGYVLAITGHTAEEWAASGFAGVLGRPIACRSCGLLLSRHAVRFGDRDIRSWSAAASLCLALSKAVSLYRP